MVRQFRKLRLSLTDACNFACVYCVSGNETHELRAQTPVADFLAWVKAIHAANPLAEIRLTGGEPTLYRDLVALVRGLKAMGIPRLAMTTNGVALARLAVPLRDAGLESVNVSLDALDETVFRTMGGRNPAAVFAGIDAALAAGLGVKLNTTLVSEMNDTQILPLLGWAKGKNIPIRFLELMAMGHLYGERPAAAEAARGERPAAALAATGGKSARLFAAEDILSVIATAFEFRALPRAPHATAHYYELEGGYRFGIIGNTSLPFCSDCDRLRLDSRGNIYGCLSSARGISVAGTQTNMTSALATAMQMKQSERFTGSPLVMRDIGG
ncbi:MAG: radical SAM protein [Spirochaetes bacterium]|nr:radical SAM protein [Spirochaetota bacterium]